MMVALGIVVGEVELGGSRLCRIILGGSRGWGEVKIVVNAWKGTSEAESVKSKGVFQVWENRCSKRRPITMVFTYHEGIV